LAVSGGPDSVALMRGMHRLNAALAHPARLLVAHFHHGWRRHEADQDAQFVRSLAAECGIPYREGVGIPPEVGKGCRGMGPEGLARQQRYHFLLETAHQAGARFVVTGHSADDQVETVLHRFLRGTGIRGLAGMRRQRTLGPDVSLVRPLLDCPRTVMAAYLAELGQSYRQDATNDSTRYTRNRLRLELLPHLRENYNPRIDGALLRLARLADEFARWTDDLLEEVWRESVRSVEKSFHQGERSDGEPPRGLPPHCEAIDWQVSIQLETLRRHSPHVVQELLVEIWRRQAWPRRRLDHETVSRLADQLLGPPGNPIRRQVSGGIDVWISEGVAWLGPRRGSP
jgi:tRNA(Ile)-lysidine synthase